MRARASSTTKLRPALRSSFAAARPAAPAPTIATSTSATAKARPAMPNVAAPARNPRREIRMREVLPALSAGTLHVLATRNRDRCGSVAPGSAPLLARHRHQARRRGLPRRLRRRGVGARRLGGETLDRPAVAPAPHVDEGGIVLQRRRVLAGERRLERHVESLPISYVVERVGRAGDELVCEHGLLAGQRHVGRPAPLAALPRR